MQKLPTRKKLNDLIINIARYTEIFMSCIITCVIIIMIFNLIIHLPETLSTTIENDAFNQFLSSALGLVVGIEFVKMLCNYTSETVIEVLMMATARQMVVEHLSPVNTLIGTFAIAVLFTIRKFLVVPEAKKAKKRKPEAAQNTEAEKTEQNTGKAEKTEQNTEAEKTEQNTGRAEEAEQNADKSENL